MQQIGNKVCELLREAHHMQLVKHGLVVDAIVCLGNIHLNQAAFNATTKSPTHMCLPDTCIQNLHNVEATSIGVKATLSPGDDQIPIGSQVLGQYSCKPTVQY